MEVEGEEKDLLQHRLAHFVVIPLSLSLSLTKMESLFSLLIQIFLLFSVTPFSRSVNVVREGEGRRNKTMCVWK